MRALRGLVLAQVAWLVVFILDGSHTIYAQSFQHPGVLRSKAQLDSMKIMVNAHVKLVVISFCTYQLHSKLVSFMGPTERESERRSGNVGGWAGYRILLPAIWKVRDAEGLNQCRFGTERFQGREFIA